MATPLPSIGGMFGFDPMTRRKIGNLLTDFGGGLLQGKNLQQGLGLGAERMAQAQPYRDQQALLESQMEKEATQTNATIEWLKSKGYTDLVAAVGGGLPIGQAWQEGLKRANPATTTQNAANFGLTPLWGTDENGNPVIAQLSDQGGVQTVQMPEGVTFGKDPIRMDAGDHFVLLDPVTRQQIGIIPKNGDVPTGYNQTAPGVVAPMQGSEQDMERRAGQTKAQTALNTLEQKQQIATGAIDKALSQAGFWTTGLAGGASSGVPGTPAFDLARTLDTIKANIGFDELQTMRDNSPTGGALGSITERELAFLQSTIANIEQAQSEEQLKQNLQILRDYLTSTQAQRRQAFQQQFGDAQTPSGGGYTVLSVE